MVELRQVYFILTRRCNLRCSHCIRDSGPGIRDRLTWEAAELALNKLAPFGKRALLLLTGGEPTLHPDIDRIAEMSGALFGSVMVNTNGLALRRLTQLYALSPEVRFQISIDGDETTHESIRGEGTFASTLRNIKALAERGANVTVATTVSGVNRRYLDGLDVALKDIPFTRWTLKRQVSYNRGASLAARIATEDWNSLVREVLTRYVNRHRTVIQPMFAPESFLPFRTPSFVDEHRLNCGTGRSKLYINPDLTVFPCACLEDLRLGDLHHDEAEQILERMRGMPVEPAADSPCRHCPAMNRCKGGCPGASLRAYGSFGVGDPRCPAVAELVG